MTKEPINETDGIHEQWMPVAQEMTMEGLPEFLRHLTEDYHHDYGTICHAIADFMDNYKVDINPIDHMIWIAIDSVQTQTANTRIGVYTVTPQGDGWSVYPPLYRQPLSTHETLMEARNAAQQHLSSMLRDA